jgi:hypothetical protein
VRKGRESVKDGGDLVYSSSALQRDREKEQRRTDRLPPPSLFAALPAYPPKNLVPMLLVSLALL